MYLNLILELNIFLFPLAKAFETLLVEVSVKGLRSFWNSGILDSRLGKLLEVPKIIILPLCFVYS